MKKPLKVFSAASLAAMMSVSAMTPVMAAEKAVDVPAEAKQLSEVVLKTADNKLASLEFGAYYEAFEGGVLKDNPVTHVGAADGSRYAYDAYYEAFEAADGNVEKALELLYKNAAQDEKSEIYEGFFDEDNKLQAKVDEQPEDRLNETFFYNVA